MRDHKKSLTNTLIHQLYELVCTPFRLASFQKQWDSFGWSYTPSIGDEFGFQVQLTPGWSLSVDPLGDEIISATLPFYYWENYDPKFHEDLGEYTRQRQEYNAAFETAASLARRLLPPPIQFWTDADEDAHKAIAWEGDHGLLILQQACFDPQFGIDLDFWLTNCSRQDFHPTMPLIDWLTEHSRKIRDL